MTRPGIGLGKGSKEASMPKMQKLSAARSSPMETNFIGLSFLMQHQVGAVANVYHH